MLNYLKKTRRVRIMFALIPPPPFLAENDIHEIVIRNAIGEEKPAQAPNKCEK